MQYSRGDGIRPHRHHVLPHVGQDAREVERSDRGRDVEPVPAPQDRAGRAEHRRVVDEGRGRLPEVERTRRVEVLLFAAEELAALRREVLRVALAARSLLHCHSSGRVSPGISIATEIEGNFVRIEAYERGGNLLHDRLLSCAALVPLTGVPLTRDGTIASRSFHTV